MDSARLQQKSANFFYKEPDSILGFVSQEAKWRILCGYSHNILCWGGPPRVVSSFAPKCPQLETFSGQRATGPRVSCNPDPRELPPPHKVIATGAGARKEETQ